jgi:hypothetical protein
MVHQSPTVTLWRRSCRLITIIVMSVLILPLLPLYSQTQPVRAQGEWAVPSTVFIPETGQTLDQVFLDQWREGGGVSAYGYPITPEITRDDGTIVQYMQYARFEYHPEGDDNGEYFTLANIGEELRPFSLQRSVALFAPTEESGETAAQAVGAVSAWIAVDPASIESDNVRYIEESAHTIRYEFRRFWEQTGEASFLGNPLTEEYIVDSVTYQVFERGQLAWKNGKDAWMVPVGQVLADKYQYDQESVQQGGIPAYSEELFIPPPPPVVTIDGYGPGPVPNTAKSIVVSISQQRMWAYEGDTVVISSLVSTGKPGFDTPVGTFSISKKVEMQDMEGLIGGEYYNVESVPDVMYFTTVGHAFHGTYWHNNFGAVMSHGCVNLPMDIASALYDWTPMATTVQIVP